MVNNNRFNMGFASRKSSLPFTIGESRSKSYIPFAEFEAAYSADHGENGVQEAEDVQTAQDSSNLSASKRAWNLMSLFPRAIAAASGTCESNSQKEINPARLDRMPKVEDGGFEQLAPWMERRSEDSRKPANVSPHVSIGEDSMDAPSIATSSTSSAKFSNNSCTQSDLLNAVEKVSSAEVVLPMNIGSIDTKRDYTSTRNRKAETMESPELHSEDFGTQHAENCDVEQNCSSFDASISRSDDAPIQEKVPSIRNNADNLIPNVKKNAEQDMAELILRQRRLLAGKKANILTSS